MFETMRLVTEDQIIQAIRILLAKGVTLEEIPVVLCELAPFDADLLADLLRKFARAG